MHFQKLPDCVFSLGGKQTEECHHSNSRTLQHQNWHHLTLWSLTDEITNVYWTFRQNMKKKNDVEYHIWYIRFYGSYRELSMSYDKFWSCWAFRNVCMKYNTAGFIRLTHHYRFIIWSHISYFIIFVFKRQATNRRWSTAAHTELILKDK